MPKMQKVNSINWCYWWKKS